MGYKSLGRSSQDCALREHQGGACSGRHSEAGGYALQGGEGGVMIMELIPLTLRMMVGRGYGGAGQEEKGGESGEMHCGGYAA